MKSGEVITALAAMNQREIMARPPASGGIPGQQLWVGFGLAIWALPGLWLGWFYGDWQNAAIASTFGFALLGVITVIFLSFGLFAHIKSRKSRDHDSSEQAAKALLAALRAPDDATLPLAPAHTALLTTDPSEASENIRLAFPAKLSLAPAARHWADPFFYMWGVIYFNFITSQSQFVSDILHGNALTLNDQRSQYDLIFNLQNTLDIVIVVVFLLSIYLMHTPGRFSSMLATPAGLQWRRFPRWVHVSWTSIRAIGCFADESKQTPSAERGRTYVIVAADALLTLNILSESTTASAAKNRTASDRLLRTIIARTGLPVRDLNPLATALAAQYTLATRQTSATGDGQGASGIASRAAELLAAFPNGRRRWRRGLLVVTALYVVVMASLPYIAYHGLHDVAQPSYLATLPGLIHRRQPLFADALRHDDGLWHSQPGINDDPLQQAFSSAGFTLSGQHAGDTVEALLSPTYGAVAIEVTVQQQGANSNDLGAGAGIVIRHAPGSLTTSDENCRFAVKSSGDWSTDCFFGAAGSSGHSSAIRRGPDAGNTLLVIARGNFYVFYINGVYVGQNFDEDSFGGSAGQVGVVNFQSGDQATFTDFTIWSVKPPPQFPFV